MNDELKAIYIMAMRKEKPVNFRVFATGWAIAIVTETRPAWLTSGKVCQMIMDYVNFNGKED